MFEGRRFVLFVDEMPNPGEAVTHYWQECQNNKIAGKEEKKHEGDDTTRSKEMELAARYIIMFLKIERVKLVKTLKSH
jgi:hypothetical protein